jgi:hypothetical protein
VKWLDFAFGRSPRFDLNHPSLGCMSEDLTKSEFGVSEVLRTGYSYSSESRISILRQEESVVWDPIDVISSERGIKDLKSQRPESISGPFISKGRVGEIEAVGKFPERKSQLSGNQHS